MASRRALLSILGAAQLFGSHVAAAPLDSGLDVCLPFGIEVGLFIDLFEPPQVTDVVTVSVTSTTSIHAAGTYAVPAGISSGTVTAHGPTELCVTSVKTTTTTYPCSTSTSFPSTWWDPCKGSSTSATCRWTPPATGAHTSASTTVTKRVTSTVTQCATSASNTLTSTATSTSSTSASNTVTDTTTSTTQSATSAPITVTITVTPTTQCTSSATATVTDTVTSTVTQSASSVPVRATTVTDTVTSTVTQSASSAPVRVTTVTDTVTDTVTSTVTQPATSCSATTTPTSTPTLSCDPYGYLIQYAELYRVDLSTGTTTEIASGLGDNSSINAIGYNTLDNYLYGYQSSTGTILQISADGTTTTVKADAPPSGSYIGDIDSNGHYWVGLGAASSWAKIDLAPGSSTYGKTLASGTTTSPGYAVADWVYIPSAGEYLYAIGSNTSPSETALLRFDMSTHKWETVANYGALGVVGVGAVYGMNNGTVYASENGNGQIWQFPVSGGKPFKVSQGPSSGNNDGARCVLNLLA